jgi:hypothetical protein
LKLFDDEEVAFFLDVCGFAPFPASSRMQGEGGFAGKDAAQRIS